MKTLNDIIELTQAYFKIDADLEQIIFISNEDYDSINFCIREEMKLGVEYNNLNLVKEQLNVDVLGSITLMGYSIHFVSHK
jgi:hypothetical protein